MCDNVACEKVVRVCACVIEGVWQRCVCVCERWYVTKMCVKDGV